MPGKFLVHVLLTALDGVVMPDVILDVMLDVMPDVMMGVMPYVQ